MIKPNTPLHLYRGHFVWTTEAEKGFLDGLGNHLKFTFNEDPKTRRLRLLLGYKKAFPSRKRWDNIEPTKVLEYLLMLIAGAENG